MKKTAYTTLLSALLLLCTACTGTPTEADQTSETTTTITTTTEITTITTTTTPEPTTTSTTTPPPTTTEDISEIISILEELVTSKPETEATTTETEPITTSEITTAPPETTTAPTTAATTVATVANKPDDAQWLGDDGYYHKYVGDTEYVWKDSPSGIRWVEYGQGEQIIMDVDSASGGTIPGGWSTGS